MFRGSRFLAALLAAVSFTLLFQNGEDLSVSGQSAGHKFREIIPVFVRASASSVSKSVGSLPPAVPEAGKRSGKMGRAEEQVREVPNRIPFRKKIENAVPDKVRPGSEFSPVPMPTPGMSFGGLNSNDNAAAYGFRIIPPDTVGDVGPSHYVQAVNALFRVSDKFGNPLTPPIKLSSLFSSLGTDCSTRDDGDPSVLYDQLADRWILSQFCTAFPPFRQMIAVSRTGDPAGEYFVYEFVMPNVKLNDYPKLSIWPDAFYMSTDEFYGSEYAGSGVFAFDREKMLAGDPSAGYIYFDLASPSTIRLGGLLPVDLEGLATPPAGLPGMFLGYTATEYGDPADAVRLFEFKADFDEPSNSSFGEAAGSPFVTPPFDPTSNDGRDDVPQPAPGLGLDSQSDRLMYRASYSRFPQSESIVVNQTVRTSAPGQPYAAGVRVHVLERQGGKLFTVKESSTIANDDASRFMGAAAMDSAGNLAVSYSTSSSEKPPTISYTGKLAGDPSGLFRNEAILIPGDGVQTAYGFRWGDYSGLTLDPFDGCTFWMTNEYYSLESQAESPFGWLTRIGSFRYPECADREVSTLTGTVTDSTTGDPIDGAAISLEGDYQRASEGTGSYGPFYLPPGIYEANVAAQGYLPVSLVIDVSRAGSYTRDLVLEPTAILEETGLRIKSESCSADGAVEPGERVTVSIPLRNIGVRDAKNLVAAIKTSNGVEDPSGPQTYGALAAGGNPVSKEFSFTVSRSIECGQELALRLMISDRDIPLNEVTIPLTAGTKQQVFFEDFETAIPPALPAGWTSNAEGALVEWTVSTDRADSGLKAAFSPDPRQIGLNELVTPPIEISSDKAELRFRNWYELETTFLRNRLYDGSVLEIRIGDGVWQDIKQAGGSFVEGGYDLGLIDSCCQNPLAGREGWSGRSGTERESRFIDSVVRLPAAARGNTVRFRWRVGTDIGTFREGQYIDDVSVTDGYVCTCGASRQTRAPFDFDGDGKTDASVFEASDSDPDFRVRLSSTGTNADYFWGVPGDEPVNADYDGDGVTDLAVLRPGEWTWFVLNSSDSTLTAIRFGSARDVPVPSDLDGDGSDDVAVYRPSDGTWYFRMSSTGTISASSFGIEGDIPVPADYDGDGISDLAVFRPSSGVWYILGSTEGFSAVQFGTNGDRPVFGDYDGDGKADLAVFRPSNSTWYFYESIGGFSAAKFGSTGDQPIQSDIDGDGRRDIALFRPSTAAWYAVRSSDSGTESFSFGPPGSTPVPGIFVR